MKNFSDSLMVELEDQLKEIQVNQDNSIHFLQQAIEIIIESMRKLEIFLKKYVFTGKSEEIEFFKTIKPQWVSKLIYYNEIYNMQSSKPLGTYKDNRKYYKKELSRLKSFFNENQEFYKYYRTGNTCLDKKYFLRRKHDIRLTLDSSCFQSDYSFSTSHDYMVARIMANDAIQLFLEEKLKKRQEAVKEVKPNEKQKELKWTGSKVALVELMYALHTEGVINNGKASLNEIAKTIEVMFDINIGQFNRIFLEIRSRKTIEKTSFLNSLQNNLLKRIELADEK